MLINYFSDIHLEFGSLETPQTEADVIIAAGDIGIYKQGLKWLNSSTIPVVYVAGNHEFYDQEHSKTLDELRKDSTNSNVNFLENDSIILGDTRFLGCTLWTQLGGKDNDRVHELKRTVNDFRKIFYQQKPIDVTTYAGLHRESLNWLTKELALPFAGKTIVITHHAPTFWSWDDSPSSLTRFAYCNDLKEIMHEYEIAAWFHGHTHSVSDYRCAGTRILCNPRGYHGRQMVEGFEVGKVVEI